MEINDNKDKSNRINQGLIAGSPFEYLDSCLIDVSKSVCKIKIGKKSESVFGSGFLLRYLINEKYFYCLMSNEHIITKDLIKNSGIIIVSYNNENKILEIKLNEKERFIRHFKDMQLDITVVEILKKDDIYKDYFLFPELDYIGDELINRQIYIPQFPLGKKLTNSRGRIKNIDKYEFIHLASTEHGSSGSPIFLKGSSKVLGIHKQGNKKNSENYGDFIYPITDILKNAIIKKQNYKNKKNVDHDINISDNKTKNLPIKKGLYDKVSSFFSNFFSSPIVNIIDKWENEPFHSCVLGICKNNTIIGSVLGNSINHSALLLLFKEIDYEIKEYQNEIGILIEYGLFSPDMTETEKKRVQKGLVIYPYGNKGGLRYYEKQYNEFIRDFGDIGYVDLNINKKNQINFGHFINKIANLEENKWIKKNFSLLNFNNQTFVIEALKEIKPYFRYDNIFPKYKEFKGSKKLHFIPKNIESELINYYIKN